MIRKVLAFSSLCLIVAACGNRSSLGSGDDNLGQGGSAGSSGSAGASGSGGNTWDPCAGKPCGAECSVCAPNDPECAETAVLKYCDESGGCGQAFPLCAPQQCTTSNDCPVDLGPCEQCPDGSLACPSVDCIAGACVYSTDSCQGQQCKSDDDCPQIGAPCQQCPDGSVACPFSGCENGQCVGGFPGCPGYEPCAGKACGDSCTQCPPNDPECSETAVLKYCDANGGCGPSFPTCGGTGQCSSAGDCPAILICLPCPDGSCAQPDCVNGKCDLVCAPVTPPECNTNLDCPQIELCKQCGNGTCAEIECVAGACEFVCKGP
jgi:hypothetical protein